MAAKYIETAHSIEQQILSGEYALQLPSESTMQERYGVSRQTIRQALKVLEARGLIEKHQGRSTFIKESAPNALPDSHRSIAIITTYISDYIFPSILREIETVFARHMCSPLLFATQNQVANERKILDILLSRPNLSGILVEGTKTAIPNPNIGLYRKLIEKNIPIVFMNGIYRELPECVSVLDDNYGGGYQLVEYLRGKGHTKIAGIFKSDDIQGHQRYSGYAEALLDSGAEVEDKNVLWFDTESKPHLLEQVEKRWSEGLSECDAIVCYNDEVAASLIQHLLKNGVSVPDDMAVVSFDNSKYSDFAAVSITSLSHEENNVGRLAAETMIKMLSGERCESSLAPWTLIKRSSG